MFIMVMNGILGNETIIEIWCFNSSISACSKTTTLIAHEKKGEKSMAIIIMS